MDRSCPYDSKTCDDHGQRDKQTEFINRVKREQISLRTILVKSILITHSHYVRISNIISVFTQELDMSSDLIETQF